MRRFKELAEENQFSPIRAIDSDLAGYLHLDGTSTKAALNSKDFHHFENDDDGWFNLEIEDHRGSRVLLHNALTQSQSMPGYAAGKSVGSYTSEIFPNIVIFGTENLRNDRTLLQLSFILEGAENFFVYDIIERHSFYGSAGGKSALKSVREEAWKPPQSLRERGYSNDPDEIYVIHHPKRYLSLDIEDMKVSVSHSRYQRGLGWAGHKIEIVPVISMIFKAPITINDALDRIWRVKGFFDQLSLDDLRISAISFSKFKKGWPSSDVYLPNEANRARDRRLEVHPIYIPFSRWNERKKFQESLYNWLVTSRERRFFRAAIRLSLVRLQQQIDPTLITLLVAGIESLSELGGKSGVSKQMINDMANAAHKMAPSVDLSSIKGMLGTLGRISPKQRLQKIAALVSTGKVDIDVEAFASATIELRNQIAHGRGFDELERAAAGHIAEALTYLCVAYDLQSSGMPSKSEDSDKRGLLATSKMNLAWMGYKMASTTQAHDNG
jgi:hypothetical protein